MDDLSKQSIEDLSKEVAQKRESLRKFRFGESGSRSRNVREGRNIRREIARILTELNKRNSSTRVASKQKST